MPAPDSAVTGRYFTRVPKSTLVLRVELKPDRTVVAEETYLIGPSPDPVYFYGTWAREGEQEVRLHLQRREQWVFERGVSKEAVRAEVVGTLLLGEQGRVSGLRFPVPAPLSSKFSLPLRRVDGD